MGAKAVTKGDTKTALLEAGMDIMRDKGYTNTGIQEVLSSVGVPKGSFYHYFESKENFAVEVIHHYSQSYTAKLIYFLRDESLQPLDRLKAYINAGRDNFLAQNCCKGCLIGNLSQEMADQSEELRQVLSQVMGKWRDLFATCIDEGQATGQISKRYSPVELAEAFLSGWEGAIMRAKTTKNIEPLDIFNQVMFDGLLKA